MTTYTIIHHRAGALKGIVEATSEVEALSKRFDVPVEKIKLEDGHAVLRYGMNLSPEPVIFHEYTAHAVQS